MPAVQLARLNLQISELIWQFTRPVDFLNRLRDLYELYANRVYRAGQAVPPRSLLPAYHIPHMVLRELEQQLRASCQQHPTAALSLVDTLAAETMLEYRLLGADLLGQIPANPPAPVVEHLQRLARPGEDPLVVEALLKKGGQRLRKEQPDAWLALLTQWINDPALSHQIIGIKAIAATASDTQFENLPPYYRLFSSVLQAGSPALQAELQVTLSTLIARSPNEMAYFLRQVLSLSISPSSRRMIRLVLPRFPADLQAGLRLALQNNPHLLNNLDE